jgi:hypothetical protein
MAVRYDVCRECGIPVLDQFFSPLSFLVIQCSSGREPGFEEAGFLDAEAPMASAPVRVVA